MKKLNRKPTVPNSSTTPNRAGGRFSRAFCLGVLVFTQIVFAQSGQTQEEFLPSILTAGHPVLKVAYASPGGKPTAILQTGSKTCTGAVVSPSRLSLNGVSISWPGKQPLQGVTAVLAVGSASLKNSPIICEISGLEFDSIFGTSGAVINGGATVQNLSSCPIQCGGIGLVNPRTAFQASGALTVVGVSTEMGAGVRVQEQASVPVQIVYTP